MDHHDFPRAVAVGMGVFLGGAAVGGPAGVADAVGAIQRLQPDGLFQIAQLALSAADLQALAVARHRDARRVVAAVLQPLQTIQNYRDDPLFPHVPHYAAHIRTPCRGDACYSRVKRNSSMTGLVKTSRAIRATSASACSRLRPPSRLISKYLPWRTSSSPL